MRRFQKRKELGLQTAVVTAGVVAGAAPVEEKEQQRVATVPEEWPKKKESLRRRNRERTVHLKVNLMAERRGLGIVPTIVGEENGCTGIVDGCGEGCNVGSDESREKGLLVGTPLGVMKGLADDSPEGIQDRSLVIGER